LCILLHIYKVGGQMDIGIEILPLTSAEVVLMKVKSKTEVVF
jgi:hypothetical protein